MMHNIRRQREAHRVRMERIITGYIETRYPNIYEEAKKVYTKLDMLYPTKKDLRKTYEFCVCTSGSTDNKYKYMRKTQDAVSGKMLLEIPLMSTSTVPAVSAQTVVPNAPAVSAQTVVPNAPTVSAPTVVPINAPTVSAPTVPDIGAEITLPFLDNEIVDEIIGDLRMDPEICTFFDNILTDGETPLETELSTSGF